MKTLFILRAYSGILKSIEDNNWETSGIISMSKLIEKFSKDKTNKFILEIPHDGIERDFYFKKKHVKKLDAYFYLFNRQFLIKKLKIKYLIILIHVIFKIFVIFFLIAKYKIKNSYIDNGNLIYAFILKKFTNLKIVLKMLTFYSIKHNLNKNWFSKNIYIKLYKANYNSVIITSDFGYDRSQYLNYFNKNSKKIEIFNGCDFRNNFLKKYYGNKIKIYFIGRLEPQKKIKTFLNAAKIILNTKFIKKIEFHIVGSGSYEDNCKKFIKSNSFQKNIIFHGKVDSKKIQNMYLDSDLIIAPNTDGFFSNVFIEATRLGVPIICQSTNRNEEEKYFKSIFYKNFLFKNLNEKEIVNQIYNFLNDRNKFITTSIYLKNFSNQNILSWKNRLRIDENLIN